MNVSYTTEGGCEGLISATKMWLGPVEVIASIDGIEVWVVPVSSVNEDCGEVVVPAM